MFKVRNYGDGSDMMDDRAFSKTITSAHSRSHIPASLADTSWLMVYGILFVGLTELSKLDQEEML